MIEARSDTAAQALLTSGYESVFIREPLNVQSNPTPETRSRGV